MRVLLNVWLPILGALALFALGYLVFNWTFMSTTHRLSFVFAILLIVHMVEEEHLPGGFPYMFNVVVRKSDAPDCYPMSPVIAMSVDFLMTIFLVAPALFFPETYWLGTAAVILGLTELLMHTMVGVAVQHRKHPHMGFYDPGLVTAWLLGITAITYISVVISDGLMSGIDWLWAVLYFVGNLVLFLIIPENLFSSRNSRWPYEHNEQFLGYYKRFSTVEEVFGPQTSAQTTSDT